MANEQEITFDEPDEGRDIYHELDDRALIRTKDVVSDSSWTTAWKATRKRCSPSWRTSRTLASPRGLQRARHGGQVEKRGEVALRLFAVVDDSVADPVFVKVGFKSRGCLAMTGCASAICSMIEGKTFSQALELTPGTWSLR